MRKERSKGKGISWSMGHSWNGCYDAGGETGKFEEQGSNQLILKPLIGTFLRYRDSLLVGLVAASSPIL